MSQFEDLQACYLKLRKHAPQEGPHANGRTPNGHAPDISNTGTAVSLILQSDNKSSCVPHDSSSVWPCSQRLLLAWLQRLFSTDCTSGEHVCVSQIQEMRRHMILAWPTETPQEQS